MLTAVNIPSVMPERSVQFYLNSVILPEMPVQKGKQSAVSTYIQIHQKICLDHWSRLQSLCVQAAEADEENVAMEPAGVVDDGVEADVVMEENPVEAEARVSTPLKRKKAADGVKVQFTTCWK